jgi:hypothetical protein
VTWTSRRGEQTARTTRWQADLVAPPETPPDPAGSLRGASRSWSWGAARDDDDPRQERAPSRRRPHRRRARSRGPIAPLAPRAVPSPSASTEAGRGAPVLPGSARGHGAPSASHGVLASAREREEQGRRSPKTASHRPRSGVPPKPSSARAREPSCPALCSGAWIDGASGSCRWPPRRASTATSARPRRTRTRALATNAAPSQLRTQAIPRIQSAEAHNRYRPTTNEPSGPPLEGRRRKRESGAALLFRVSTERTWPFGPPPSCLRALRPAAPRSLDVPPAGSPPRSATPPS